jgi:hypothetical protein
MKIKILFLCLSIAGSVQLVWAQSDTTKTQKQSLPEVTGLHRKSVFLETGGNGLIFSANFEQRFKKERNNGWGFRGGVGIPIWDNNETFPLAINYIGGKRKLAWEGGIGITPYLHGNTFSNSTGSGAMILLNLGDRFQSIRNGFLLRLNSSLAYDIAEKRVFRSITGLSLGYSFK